MDDCACPRLWIQDFCKSPVFEWDRHLSDALLGNAVCYRARTWSIHPLVSDRDRSPPALVHVEARALPRELDVIQHVLGRKSDEMHILRVGRSGDEHVEVPDGLSCLSLRVDAALMRTGTSDVCTLTAHAVFTYLGM